MPVGSLGARWGTLVGGLQNGVFFQVGRLTVVGLTGKKLIGARDPVGLRPLVLGRLGDAYVLASETCALDIIGAEFVREVENGEIVGKTDGLSETNS